MVLKKINLYTDFKFFDSGNEPQDMDQDQGHHGSRFLENFIIFEWHKFKNMDIRE